MGGYEWASNHMERLGFPAHKKCSFGSVWKGLKSSVSRPIPCSKVQQHSMSRTSRSKARSSRPLDLNGVSCMDSLNRTESAQKWSPSNRGFFTIPFVCQLYLSSILHLNKWRFFSSLPCETVKVIILWRQCRHYLSFWNNTYAQACTKRDNPALCCVHTPALFGWLAGGPARVGLFLLALATANDTLTPPEKCCRWQAIPTQKSSAGFRQPNRASIGC